MSSNIVLLTQAFRKKFVIPDFEEFTGHVDRIFEDAKELTGGKVRAREMGVGHVRALGQIQRLLGAGDSVIEDEKPSLPK